jgi:hypothetical protein
MVSSVGDVDVLHEFVFFLRRQVSCGVPKRVILTLHLIDTLVKNCGYKFRVAIDDKKFLSKLDKIARGYNDPNSREIRSVAQLCLDIIQSWAERFGFYESLYPNICNLYETLVLDGLPFRERAIVSGSSSDSMTQTFESNNTEYDEHPLDIYDTFSTPSSKRTSVSMSRNTDSNSSPLSGSTSGTDSSSKASDVIGIIESMDAAITVLHEIIAYSTSKDSTYAFMYIYIYVLICSASNSIDRDILVN